jgi:hypothetical protein
MKKLIAITSAFAICLAFGMAHGDEKPAATAKAPSLDCVKKLVGDWYEADKDGKPTTKLVSSFRVTAGGSAVREILFPDTEMEMVSIYTQEGSDLILTHYCILGNQPRFRAEAGKQANQVIFKCVGGGNLNVAKDAHMGQGTLTLVDNDHLQLECVKCENGKACESHKMSLVRKK